MSILEFCMLTSGIGLLLLGLSKNQRIIKPIKIDRTVTRHDIPK